MVAALPRSRYLKGPSRLVVQSPDDGVGGVQAALHGHLGHAGQVVESHHVADHEHLGVPGEGEVGQYGDAAGAVELGAGSLGQLGGQRRRFHPGGPHRGVGVQPAGDAGARR